MPYHPSDDHPLTQEHGVLLRRCGALQGRCTALVDAHQREIAQLQAQLMQLRAQVIVRDTALQWAQEDRLQHLSAIALNAAVNAVRCCVAPAQASASVNNSVNNSGDHSTPTSLQAVAQHAADLVICQTGCISHGGYWREDERCKRTGTTCQLESAATSKASPTSSSTPLANTPHTSDSDTASNLATAHRPPVCN